MFADDRPNYPMAFVVELTLTGQIRKHAFEDAVRAALQRHPLLTAMIGPGKGGKDCWVEAANTEPFIRWRRLGGPIEFPTGEYIDLRNEVGLRIFVGRDDEQAVVTAQFHHAVCDGIGSYQFLGDVLYEYAQRSSENALPPLPESDPKRLRARSQASYNINNFRLESGKYQRTWDIALKHLMRQNIVLKSASDEINPSNPYPGIKSYVFEKDAYKELRLLAQSRGQVLNDMLVEKLFETLHQWNRRQSYWRRKKHACIMMPMNLREVDDNDISACNIVAHAFLRRTEKELADKQQFRQKLASDLLHLKASRHKIRFMHMIAGGHYIYPRILKWSLDWKRNLATAVLSNTGDPTKQFLADFPRLAGAVQVGNLVLEDIAGVPPLRPGTNATISIFTYRRRLKICLRCDPQQFSELDTHHMLNSYIANLTSDLNAKVEDSSLVAA